MRVSRGAKNARLCDDLAGAIQSSHMGHPSWICIPALVLEGSGLVRHAGILRQVYGTPDEGITCRWFPSRVVAYLLNVYRVNPKDKTLHPGSSKKQRKAEIKCGLVEILPPWLWLEGNVASEHCIRGLERLNTLGFG